MSNTLARLTAESEKDTTTVVGELEHLSGLPSEDVRLISETRRDALRIISSLGLDPHDTTAEELYQVLQVKLSSDARQFAKAINYEAGNNELRAAKLVELAVTASPTAEAFAIKKAAAKNLLRSSVPTRLMKKLNYRSLESMLKREDVCELYAVLPIVESRAWQKTFINRLAGLKSSDFETREISYHVMSGEKWRRFFSEARPVSYAPLSGVVTVWPVESLSKPESACFSLLLLQAAEVLEVDSLYLKNYRFQPQFGELASRLYESGEQQNLEVSGKTYFDWHNLKQLFDPKISPLESFVKLHPTFRWWKNTNHAALLGEQVVSSHLADVLRGLIMGVAFDSRSVHNGTSEIKNSLLAKYLSNKNVASYFRAQLDDTNLALEPVTAEQLISSELEAGLI